MKALVKLALRITTTAFDDEIEMLIADAEAEIRRLGIAFDSEKPEIQSAVVCYCKWKFGDSDTSDKWEKIYHEKLGQLKVASNG